MTDDFATAKILSDLQERTRPAIPSRYQNLGRVVQNGSRATVETFDGSMVYVPQGNIATNGAIGIGNVIVNRPSLGQPFATAQVRGRPQP